MQIHHLSGSFRWSCLLFWCWFWLLFWSFGVSKAELWCCHFCSVQSDLPKCSVFSHSLWCVCRLGGDTLIFCPVCWYLFFGVILGVVGCLPLCDWLTVTVRICSRKDSADFQHWDEEQDEGSHHDRRCDLLEVDLSQHRCPGHRQRGLPLEHGGWLSTNQSLWPSL